MMRYEHPLIIYELDGVLADCAVRESVDKSSENRYAIGCLCHDLYLGIDLLPDIQALEAILERDRKI